MLYWHLGVKALVPINVVRLLRAVLLFCGTVTYIQKCWFAVISSPRSVVLHVLLWGPTSATGRCCLDAVRNCGLQ